jgi:hypothetical protein
MMAKRRWSRQPGRAVCGFDLGTPRLTSQCHRGLGRALQCDGVAVAGGVFVAGVRADMGVSPNTLYAL